MKRRELPEFRPCSCPEIIHPVLPKGFESHPLLEIGWIRGKDVEYRRGIVDADTISSLIGMCEHPAIILKTIDRCPLCHVFESPYRVTYENKVSNEIHAGIVAVIGRNAIYVTTTLIMHFILSHEYVPPEQFIEALQTGYRLRSDGQQAQMAQQDRHGVALSTADEHDD